jgi:hypothetical protein
LGRAIGASRSLAVFATVDEASNEEAAAFYRDFGFISFPSRPLRPFILMLEAAEAATHALSHQPFCALSVIIQRYGWIKRCIVSILQLDKIPVFVI